MVGERVHTELRNVVKTPLRRLSLVERNSKSVVSEEDHRCLINFVGIDSAEKIEEFSDFVASLQELKVQGEIQLFVNYRLVGSQRYKRVDPAVPQQVSVTDERRRPRQHSSDYEHQQGSTNLLTSIKLSLVEAIESVRKADEGVAPRAMSRLIAACNMTRKSTTMRKFRKSRELEEERDVLEMETNAEKEARNAAAAHLKALQACEPVTHKLAAKWLSVFKVILIFVRASKVPYLRGPNG
ncbi:hypothetical protein B0H19DRAFT_1061662 [Mycena capillaripes]|nr:hypothetical protein B0H19DRAFT_1061662 [Mycena capillaripes]